MARSPLFHLSRLRPQQALSALSLAALLFACSSDLPTEGSGGGDGDGDATGDGDTPGDGDMAGTGGTGDGDGAGGSGMSTGGSGMGTGGGSITDGTWTSPVNAWPSDACVSRVDTLLAAMSVQDKASQMVMEVLDAGGVSGAIASGELGNVFAGGGNTPAPGDSSKEAWGTAADSFISASGTSPHQIPILLGVDAVHGHNKAIGAVIFPHNIGLGATRNAELIEQIGEITAKEMAATGATWTFGPMLSVSHDDRWGRSYETYSEDPIDVALFGAAIVSGLQGRDGLGSGSGVVACAKHFAGDGLAAYGTNSWRGGTVDRAEVNVTEEEMMTYGVEPYLPAIAAGLGSVMVGDTYWNGTYMTESADLISRILKEEIGFEGFVTTDWDAVNTQPGASKLVSAINAGVDMLMAPTIASDERDDIIAAVGNGQIPQARMDDAVRRILTVKCEAGLFDWTRPAGTISEVGSVAHREVSRQAVRESLVLLSHENSVLPLAADASVFLTGSAADSPTQQAGGWTINWQGEYGSTTSITTVKEAMEVLPGVTLVADVAEADVAVVVLGESGAPYAEWRGDRDTLELITPEDWTALSEARASGKPVVAILITGRPVLITDHLADADAWIAAWLPGSEGQGITDVLFGDTDFTGTLSHSWPRVESDANKNKGDAGFDPLFAYGHGLTMGL